jgi:hypothetical protein
MLTARGPELKDFIQVPLLSRRQLGFSIAKPQIDGDGED